MAKFFMIPKNTKDIVRGWLEKGDHDLKSAEILLKSNEDVMDVACYHCHQAVEKYLKGFLVFKNVSFSKTHDLDYLFKHCIKEELAFHSIESSLYVLVEFSEDCRYPTEGETSCSLEDAQRGMAATQEIIKFIHSLLGIKEKDSVG